MSRANHFRPEGNHTNQGSCTVDLCLDIVTLFPRSSKIAIQRWIQHSPILMLTGPAAAPRLRGNDCRLWAEQNSFQDPTCASKVGNSEGTALLHTQQCVQLEALKKTAPVLGDGRMIGYPWWTWWLIVVWQMRVDTASIWRWSSVSVVSNWWDLLSICRMLWLHDQPFFSGRCGSLTVHTNMTVIDISPRNIKVRFLLMLLTAHTAGCATELYPHCSQSNFWGTVCD